MVDILIYLSKGPNKHLQIIVYNSNFYILQFFVDNICCIRFVYVYNMFILHLPANSTQQCMCGALGSCV